MFKTLSCEINNKLYKQQYDIYKKIFIFVFLNFSIQTIFINVYLEH